jgi:hypothetical protein
MPVADPHSWSHLAFGDQTSFIDFLGTHALFHRALDVKVRSLGGAAYNYLPIGDGGGESWLLAVQQAHQGPSTALGIAAPPDLTAYDLKDPDEFATFCYLLALDDIRLRQAAGI